MPSVPPISVVMSTYNDAAFLAESIDSVLSQDFTDFEFVIVNDGSVEADTAEILARYAALDPRIRVIAKLNEGLTKALIDGCAAARGEYIARMDVGDVMIPARLQLQKEYLDTHPDVVFVSCWTEYCGPQWEHLHTDRGLQIPADGLDVIPGPGRRDLLAGPTSHPSVMFRRRTYEQVGQYRWQFYFGQDWDLWYRLAEKGRFGMVPKALYRVRLLPRGISARHHRCQEAIGRCALEAFRCRRRGEDESKWLAQASTIRPAAEPARSPRQEASGSGLYLVGECLRRNGDARARGYLWQAARQSPLQAKYWFRWVQSCLRLGRK